MTATKMVTSYNLGCVAMSPCLANELRSPERERILEYQDGQSQQKDPHEGGRMVEQGKEIVETEVQELERHKAHCGLKTEEGQIRHPATPFLASCAQSLPSRT